MDKGKLSYWFSTTVFLYLIRASIPGSPPKFHCGQTPGYVSDNQCHGDLEVQGNVR